MADTDANADPMDTCSLVGCDQQNTGRCAHCKTAGYCGVQHMIQDYGRHAQECASCLQTTPGSVMWGVEVEVGQSHGAKDLDWEPADLVHGRVDRRGIVTCFVSNRDLLAGQSEKPTTASALAVGDKAEDGKFNSVEIFPGSRANTVLPGRRVGRNDHSFTQVWLSIASGGTSVAKFLVPIHLPHHDVVGMGAQGTTVHVQQHDFTRIYSTNLPPIPERGTLVAGLQIGGRKWEIWGHYNLVEHKEGAFLARTYQRARHGAGRLARLGQGAVIRIKGQDEHGTQVAVTFRRMSTGREGGDIYQVQSMTIHVPQTGAQRSVERDFLNAEDINPYGDVIDPNVALSPYGGGGDDDDMAPPPPPPPDDDEPIVPGMGILTGAAKATRDALEGAADVLTGMESRIATPVTLTRTNPENRVHVAALINAVAAQQAELKELFQDMELTGDPVEVKQIQRELTEVARLRSVLETHLAILAAEAAGEKELENISSNVHAAISQSHSLIGISPGNRFSRWSETRRLRRRARTMSRDDATAAFLQAVADAEAAQANSQVGTQFIERANIYYERLLQVSGHGQASVKDAAAKLQYLKATEHRRYKGKEQRKKQQRGKVDAEEEERLASGQ